MRAPSAEELLVVQKTLSGVARMSRRSSEGWEGRYGRGRIVQMLCGSRSQEILTVGLDQLSTYGILKDKGVGYLNALMRALADGGLVMTVSGEYPLLTLTPLGERVMRGEAAFTLVWPAAAAGKLPCKITASTRNSTRCCAICAPKSPNARSCRHTWFSTTRPSKVSPATARPLPRKRCGCPASAPPRSSASSRPSSSVLPSGAKPAAARVHEKSKLL